MLKIHHLGYVVRDIDQFADNLVNSTIIKGLYDEAQEAELALIQQSNIFIELILPSKISSFTYNFLQNGGGYHHICYEVSSKALAEDIIRKKRMIKVLDWVYAPLLESDVVFAFNKNKEVVEFVCL